MAEARATIRFETRPDEPLQIGSGAHRIAIADVQANALFFVATLSLLTPAAGSCLWDEKQNSWFTGMGSAFQAFGGVPRKVFLDNDWR